MKKARGIDPKETMPRTKKKSTGRSGREKHRSLFDDAYPDEAEEQGLPRHEDTQP